MTEIQLEALIALMEKRAEDAAKSPEDARRHLVEAGIMSADGTLAPEYKSAETTEEAAAA